MKYDNIILQPVVSEKTVGGEGAGKYTFKVLGSSNKSEIKKAIESIFSTTVDSVNIVNTKSKKRRRGRVVGKVSGFKKAIVTLEKGKKIKLREEKKETKKVKKNDVKTTVKKVEKVEEDKKEKKTGVKTRVKKAGDSSK